MAVAIGMLIIYFYCYFGKRATDCFMNMTDCLFESNWPTISIDLQKYFIFMIRTARKPIHYNGSRIVNVNLETFTVVSLNLLISINRATIASEFCFSYLKRFSLTTWCLKRLQWTDASPVISSSISVFGLFGDYSLFNLWHASRNLFRRMAHRIKRKHPVEMNKIKGNALILFA